MSVDRMALAVALDRKALPSIFPFFCMETVDHPKVLHRYTENSPDIVVEVRVDRQSQASWIELFAHLRGRWHRLELSKQQAAAIESMLRRGLWSMAKHGK